MAFPLRPIQNFMTPRNRGVTEGAPEAKSVTEKIGALMSARRPYSTAVEPRAAAPAELLAVRGPAGDEAPALFDLPDTPQELTSDPRTGLALVSVPPQLVAPLSGSFGPESLIHFVGVVEKMNHRQVFKKRILVITTYCIYVMDLHGSLARALQVVDIGKLWVCSDQLDAPVFALLVPGEFDLVLRTPQAEAIQGILKVIYQWKKGKDMEVADLSSPMIMANAKVAKLRLWRPEMLHVHTKAELFERLKRHNEKDATADFDRMEVDPRTGLQLMSIPKCVQPLFFSGIFHAERQPLLHMFTTCQLITSMRTGEKRYCLVSNSCLYIADALGRLERCVPVSSMLAVAVQGPVVAVKLPAEHDLILSFQQAEIANAAAVLFQTIHRFKRGAELLITDQIDIGLYTLKPAKAWRPEIRPVLTRVDLVRHLRDRGIQPGDQPDGALDALEAN